MTSTFEGNLELIYKSVSESLSLPNIRFDSLFAMMDYLKTLDKKILLIIDEYPYLKQTKKKNEVDSYMKSRIKDISRFSELAELNQQTVKDGGDQAEVPSYFNRIFKNPIFSPLLLLSIFRRGGRGKESKKA